ncbi:helix-turn-helix domain-containing protein [Thioalkalivibrio sulfidiphilus]|uniref:helix-turn-helix domain-containing protein n=1 Tax=Thioalkalivibrio sulfidiphilus TaxID=1033854 RepID=UPI0003631966|nr:helix-turn-helix transcriptional regulator [Thioalkalivibrio sulfidiphilus]
MTDFLDRWTTENSDNARLVAQERLITQVTEAIWKEMEDAGVTKTELSDRMGTSKGYISQILSGSRNMTLRTLADICFALGREANISLRRPQAEGWISESIAKVTLGRPKVRYKRTGNVVSPMDHWKTAA